MYSAEPAIRGLQGGRPLNRNCTFPREEERRRRGREAHRDQHSTYTPSGGSVVDFYPPPSPDGWSLQIKTKYLFLIAWPPGVPGAKLRSPNTLAVVAVTPRPRYGKPTPSNRANYCRILFVFFFVLTMTCHFASTGPPLLPF